jgi:regulator of extracellular matrix RemA (YlzA/DUF370 family)
MLLESRELTEAGPGGRVAMSRVLAVGKWESAPIRRAARKAKTEGRLIDLTYGYACKWALFLDSGHVVLATAMLDGGSEVPVEEGIRKEEVGRSKDEKEKARIKVKGTSGKGKVAGNLGRRTASRDRGRTATRNEGARSKGKGPNGKKQSGSD